MDVYTHLLKEPPKDPDPLPCRKCGSNKARLGDCGYSSFNVFMGECLDCGFKVMNTCGCMPDRASLIRMWNWNNTEEAGLRETLKQVLEKLEENKITAEGAKDLLRQAIEDEKRMDAE